MPLDYRKYLKVPEPLTLQQGLSDPPHHGTVGSDGVAYLRSTLPKRAFLDLWRVRSQLGQEPE